jgi:hypothetical protein
MNGAAPAENTALISAAAELAFLNGWTLGVRFDGEFGTRTGGAFSPRRHH